MSVQLRDNADEYRRTAANVYGLSTQVRTTPAQGSAPARVASGRRGRGFKSRHPDSESGRAGPVSLQGRPALIAFLGCSGCQLGSTRSGKDTTPHRCLPKPVAYLALRQWSYNAPVTGGPPKGYGDTPCLCQAYGRW